MSTSLKKRVANTEVALLDDWDLPPATLRPDLNWDRDLLPFAKRGVAGLHHQSHLALIRERGLSQYILQNTTLLYDCSGKLVGRLNQYPNGYPSLHSEATALPSGTYSIVVKSSRRGMGHGLALLTAADERWGLDFWKQEYTEAGRALVIRYLNGAHEVGTIR